MVDVDIDWLSVTISDDVPPGAAKVVFSEEV